MPNHWESSARPLFVKTVFINGSRHAILFEKDPLLRCVNSPLKKTSRPNSSLSFASNLTISSSEESENTTAECKTFKFKNIAGNHGKDLSTELQNCLVKFKLASDGYKNKYKPAEEKCLCHLKPDCKGEENSRPKKHKGNRDKSAKRSEQFFEEQNEYKVTERKSSTDKSCYIYNLENYKRRKNYSFVKITSQPPQFILNCTCENDWNETHNCNPRKKNNLVISASIQNLVMTPTESDNFLEKTFDYVFPFENSELNWNSYLTKSYYNSLAERVFQWLDLTRKRKKSPERLNSTDTKDCETTAERIYSGKKFAEEIQKNEDLRRANYKASSSKKNGLQSQSDASEEEIEEKVVKEQNVETLLSLEKKSKNTQECTEKTGLLEKPSESTAREEQKQPGGTPSHLKTLTNSPPNSTRKESNSSIYNIIKTPLKIQDLFVNLPSMDTNLFRNDSDSVKNTKELPYNASSRHEKRDIPVKEDDKRGAFTEKSDNPNKHQQCYCNRSLDKYADDINSQILTGEFAERNQKSINNLNNTRTRPVLIQNLSPQQHDKISSFEEEKIVWASEKSTGRPQLHIFMPSVLLIDQSDDNMSECEISQNS